MGKKLRIHLLKKLRKAFEFKRNEDKHHEAFRWNKIKHVNAIARKINFQKKKVNKPQKKKKKKQKKKKIKTKYDELFAIWRNAAQYIRMDGTEMDDQNEEKAEYLQYLVKKFKKDIEKLPWEQQNRLLEMDNWM